MSENQALSPLQLSGDKSVPAYQQIKDAIREKIQQGDWRVGQAIPSENQLAELLNVSRMTINRPFRELTEEGFLRRVHGLGTFVAEPPRHAHLVELVSIADEIKNAGGVHRAELLEQSAEHANKALAERFNLAPNSKVYKVTMVHYQNDVPIQFEQRYVNPNVLPDFGGADFSEQTPADYLINALRPDELEHIVQAIIPSKEIAQYLDIPAAEPCLKLRRRTWKDGLVVTSVDLIYPSSRYDLGARYSPS